MRKGAAILIVVFALLIAAPSSALAVQVAADCGFSGNGGLFHTRGTAQDLQQHWHQAGYQGFQYYGWQVKTKNWGWRVGYQYGEVQGVYLQNPYAYCPG